MALVRVQHSDPGGVRSYLPFPPFKYKRSHLRGESDIPLLFCLAENISASRSRNGNAASLFTQLLAGERAIDPSLPQKLLVPPLLDNLTIVEH